MPGKEHIQGPQAVAVPAAQAGAAAMTQAGNLTLHTITVLVAPGW